MTKLCKSERPDATWVLKRHLFDYPGERDRKSGRRRARTFMMTWHSLTTSGTTSLLFFFTLSSFASCVVSVSSLLSNSEELSKPVSIDATVII